MSRLFVGNISFEASEEDIRDLFESRGYWLESTELLRNMETGQLRGFGFVQLRDGKQLKQAIQALNRVSLKGRPLTVNGGNPGSDSGTGGSRLPPLIFVFATRRDGFYWQAGLGRDLLCLKAKNSATPLRAGSL